MDNIEKLQNSVKSYIEKKLEKSYDFNLWKDTLVDCRNKRLDSAIERWNFFKGDLIVINLIADVRATDDKWAPTLHIDFKWIFDKNSLQIRAILVKNEVLFVQVVDMKSVFENFRNDYDFAKEFEKNVSLIDALKNS